MSDEDIFQAAGSDASLTFPMKAGDIKKGSIIVIKGKPCKIEEVTTSKTGKHGHAKANFYGYDIFTNKRYEDVAPTSANVAAALVDRSEFLLTDIDDSDVNADGAIVTLMDAEGTTREDLRLPEDDDYKNLRAAFEDGSKDVYVTVISSMGISKIDSQFATK